MLNEPHARQSKEGTYRGLEETTPVTAARAVNVRSVPAPHGVHTSVNAAGRVYVKIRSPAAVVGKAFYREVVDLDFVLGRTRPLSRNEI